MSEPGECVTKEDCRRIHEDITYQLNDLKDQVDGVDKKLYDHDRTAQKLCSDVKIIGKDVDRLEQTLQRTSEIVERTAQIQEQAEKDRAMFQKQSYEDKEFYRKLILRITAVGIVIVLGFFGIKMGEYLGVLGGNIL